MSFFGFDTSGHNQSAAGFSQAHNPFAGLSNRDQRADALEFEDTYDGLGDQLDETDDAFNDDTFGGDLGGPSLGPVGNDFDFAGRTAKVANAFEEELARFHRQAPAPKAAAPPMRTAPLASPYNHSQPVLKPARTGYEKYSEERGELEVDAALWGVAPQKPATPASATDPSRTPSRKILSLEEVEAQMHAQAKKITPAAVPSPAPMSGPTQALVAEQLSYDGYHHLGQAQHAQHVPKPSRLPNDLVRASEASQPFGHGHLVTILRRPQPKPTSQPQRAVRDRQQPPVPVQPTQILQNPKRMPGDTVRIAMPALPASPNQPMHPPHPMQAHQDTFSHAHQLQLLAHPPQVAQLSEQEKMAYLELETRRAKRNRKILLMSRDNGIMTPPDKNFIIRIQLQQLMSATGNSNEHGTDDVLAEDFYYQVHSQIQGGHRHNPSQPLNNFAQTYLFQTGSRQSGTRQRHRGPENHMQRMEQQVQRAVEAAKNKPKNKQLVIEGSLGKISFSNAKTPKPLLNIKRSDSAGDAHWSNSPKIAHATTKGRDRRGELLTIEKIYEFLMKMEDHDRIMPPHPSSEVDVEGIQKSMAWSTKSDILNQKLWKALRVHDHPQDGLHPFIAVLGYNKGRKAMQRIFRHTTREQRITILTLIIMNLDHLDVVRDAQVDSDLSLNASLRETIELFSMTVMATLFSFVNELELDLVSGILGLLSSRRVEVIAKSRIGISMLTIILSRAEIIKVNGDGSEASWQSWNDTYNILFDKIEPVFPYMFPGPVSSGEDVYVWQLLAAFGIGANPQQQQRLVLAVKDRVMVTVDLAKTLPPDMATKRLQNVNLFMRSIGLDVELLK